MGARGNSGVILSQILRGMTSTFKGHGDVDAARVADALTAAADRRLPGRAEAGRGHDPDGRPRVGRGGAGRRRRRGPARRRAAGGPRRRQGAPSTARPSCCRCSRTPASSTPGAPASCCCSTAALHVVDGEPLPEPELDLEVADGPVGDRFAAVAHRGSGVDGELDVSEQRYEVMYFCELADERIDAFKERVGRRSATRSSSSAATACGTATSTPTTSARRSRRRSTSGGRPKQIRVTDLFEEVADEHADRTADMATATLDTPAAAGVRSRAGGGLPAVTCAVVAVCSGDGMRRAVLRTSACRASSRAARR